MGYLGRDNCSKTRRGSQEPPDCDWELEKATDASKAECPCVAKQLANGGANVESHQ